MGLRQFGREDEGVREEVGRTLCLFLSASDERTGGRGASGVEGYYSSKSSGHLEDYAVTVALCGGATELHQALSAVLPLPPPTPQCFSLDATLHILQALIFLASVPLRLSHLAKLDLGETVLDHLDFHVRYPGAGSHRVVDALAELIAKYCGVDEEEGGDFFEGVRGALPLLSWAFNKYGEALCPNLPLALSAFGSHLDNVHYTHLDPLVVPPLSYY